jgi:DNA gyrase/topoisomerase IV subunit B
MAAFKLPDHNDRMGASALAKQKALEQLKAKPPVDEAVVAARIAAREAREAADAEKRAAKRAAEEEAKRLKREKAQAAAVPAAAPAPELTEAERKAIRDAKYAARKNRKK